MSDNEERRLADAMWRGEMSAMMKDNRADLIEIKEILKAQNSRIATLERWRSGLVTAYAGAITWIGLHK